MKTNAQLELAYKMLESTGTSVFLTGKAGTGKTTFLRNFRASSSKRMVVLAPTGVAAINAAGVTIHSFFQLPFCPFVPDMNFYDDNPKPTTNKSDNKALSNTFKYRKEKINILRSLDLIVIDEISMVRADVLDTIDIIMRKYKNPDKPFGGVQILMIGDLQQLAPVVKDDEWEILSQFYQTPFFFSSKVLQQSYYVCIELKEIFRQNDINFINLLNRIRDNNIDNNILETLNQRFNPQFNPKDDEGYITLTTHNNSAKIINDDKLDKIEGCKTYKFDAVINGDFPAYMYPTDETLILKKNAQVMFLKNDSSPEKRYYNGKLGVVTDVYDNFIQVKCFGEDETIKVEKTEWTNVKYSLDKSNNEIKEETNGVFTQYPLKLAWAITIHKSQGLTFDKVIIDGEAAFAHGQIYVALSRCRTLEGIVLISKINRTAILNNQAVKNYCDNILATTPDEKQLYDLKKNYFTELLLELFSFNTLMSNFNYLIGITMNNLKNIYPDLIKTFVEARTKLNNEVCDYEQRFKVQIINLIKKQEDYDTDSFIKERICKGAEYYYSKLKEILSPVTNAATVEIDNADISQTYYKSFDKFNAELKIKYETLNTIRKKGFTVTAYLSQKSTASIGKPDTKKILEYKNMNNSIKHKKLYYILREWRQAEADMSDQADYMIMQQKTLVNLVNELPTTKDKLLKIKGIGKVTAKKYGDELIEIIKEYKEDNNIHDE
ncbi:MAG: HRDC domain-containing protein [Bacteroidales bacterium]|nr:HRDC domain-containing protein [Bacteroidales bacterium]MDD2205177.1 HRDC domain-containing protein [Bacteroidales bacterium]MDD3914697.1 HRDC domain-containing protein [Bacteroidales bacterium]MDD4634557.1 HRDC domain-containing protein [Bacteroidales bacterium]